MLWWIGAGLIFFWFILGVVAHQRGWIHMLLLAGIAILVVQIAAYRKTKYQRAISDK